MSSGFVSGGTADNPIERDDEWKQAQREIEEKRREKEEIGKQNEGKSLYEVLQANKGDTAIQFELLTQDAKQEAFEQAARYKLHVTLNDDEADYLEGLLEAKRKEELNVKKETREQLELFRRQQEEAERRALEEDNTEAPKEDQVQWAAPGRKRKKGPDSTLLRGIKLRKSSSATEERQTVETSSSEKEKGALSALGKDAASSAANPTTASPAVTASKTSVASPPAKPSNMLSLGLGYASSDEDD